MALQCTTQRRAAGLLSRAAESGDPVLRLIASRARDGSRPRERSDGARVALAIEGGGMAGAVSAGMCAALEALGLIDSFDVIYGSSAGAINASYTAGGQAREAGELYLLAAREGLIDVRRAALLRPPFRLAQLGGRLLDARPHRPAVLELERPLRITAARVDDKAMDALGGFTSLEELRTALMASCANPVLVGDVVTFGGRRYVDGGLIESVPFRVALSEGATHVLVLRSRHADYRAPDLRGVARHTLSRMLRGAPEAAAEMVFEWPALYNADARDLQAPARADLRGHVRQLTPPADRRATSCYERRPGRLRRRILLGAGAVYAAFA